MIGGARWVKEADKAAERTRMPADQKIVIETSRLMIRLATVGDIALIHQLWTDPRVMSNVGFPQGLAITREEIRAQIISAGMSEFEQLLVVELKATGQAIGQCKMNRPGIDGIAETDIKLRPAFWGNRYGVEVKRRLLDYLFTHTDCRAVQATPNVANTASIKMQAAVGGTRVGESIFQFPESMRGYAAPVHHYIYRVSRTDWQKQFYKEPSADETKNNV